MKFKILGSILILLLLQCSHLLAQSSRVVQGSVLSKADNEPMIGAYVLVKDASERVLSATITDFSGQFVTQVKSETNILDVSFLGFVTQTIVVGKESNFTILIDEDKHEISEVQIVGERVMDNGGFSIPQREVATAVQTFNLKDLEGVQSTSLDEALQGRIAGLDIVSNSGDLGSGSSMRIRGTSSINAGSEPLIVVNDVIYDTEIESSFDFSSSTDEQYASMLSINPDDIESISVLKDAASTAIWGSRGANGVISIQTKKGVRGPTKIQYSYRLTGTMQSPGLNMLNGDDYTMMMKQAYFNTAQNEDAARIRELMYDKSWSEYQNFDNNTDWVDEVTQLGVKHDHHISIFGGGERASYRVSAGVLKQTGTIIAQEMTRYTTLSQLDYKVSDRIKIISEFSFTYSKNNRNYQYVKDQSLLGIAYVKMPNVSVYDQNPYSDGGYYNISRENQIGYSSLNDDQRNLMNPVALANLGKNISENYRIRPSFKLQYDLIDPNEQTLRYNLIVSFDANNNKDNKFLPGEASSLEWDNVDVNLAQFSDSQSSKATLENKMTWRPNFSNTDHTLLLQGSYWMYTGQTSGQGSVTTNLPSDALIDPSILGYTIDVGSSRSAFRANAITFQSHYTYKQRYILGFTLRRDGSTKFGDGNKYGNFPGISLKWIASDEPFMYGTSHWLSFLALRPTYGVGGNPPKDEYLHFSRYSSYGKYMDLSATRPTTMRLNDLKWETSKSYNLGADIGFFDEKIRFDFNYYKKTTEDLLFEKTPVSSTSGYSNISWANVGTMENTGWEVYAYTNNLIKAKDFRFDLNFNIANNKNIIIDLDDAILATYNTDYDYNNGSYLTRVQENNPYGSIYGFKYKGVYQYSDYVEGKQESAPVAKDRDQQVIVDEYGEALPMYFAYGESQEYEFQGGDAQYEDVNNDGSIDELDIVYLGNANPKFYGGFGTTMNYKNFYFRTFFNFRYGNQIINAARMGAENMHSNNNQSSAVNWRWRKDGDDTMMPRALFDAGYNWLGSDRFVEDGSFLRFKNITLGYSIPRKKLERYNIERLSFSCTINNIYVWTKYTGVDPEVGIGANGLSVDSGKTPRPRDCTLGLSITF